MSDNIFWDIAKRNLLGEISVEEMCDLNNKRIEERAELLRKLDANQSVIEYKEYLLDKTIIDIVSKNGSISIQKMFG